MPSSIRPDHAALILDDASLVVPMDFLRVLLIASVGLAAQRRAA
jgi:hypothetical protein